MENTTNIRYQQLLNNTYGLGDRMETRNHETFSDIFSDPILLTKTPLVTVRKTAWKKAIREMEWFLSGDSECPEELMDWWNGQLRQDNCYADGYPWQLRCFTDLGEDNFDQIKWLISELKAHPNSRRLLTTTWHPGEMARITETNDNPDTPTTCHGTITQYFVRDGKIFLKTYQRSADLLLGVPHNWIQYWAYLMWLAHRTSYKVGGMYWIFGDAHIYNEPSHIAAIEAILRSKKLPAIPELIYTPTSEEFRADDFTISIPMPEPITDIRPKLL